MSLKALLLGLVFALIWSSAFTSARVIVNHASTIRSTIIKIFSIGHSSFNHRTLVKADIQIDKETVAGNGGIWGLSKYHLPWPKFCSDAVD